MTRGHMTKDAATTGRRMRADGRRNRETLLEAAKAVFARAGTDAPMDDVAKQAGVGRGTLYRHFPTREHLFVAIMKEQVDQLEEQARALIDEPDAWTALTRWLHMYARSASRYRGMSAQVGNGLVEDSSPMAAACAPMKVGFADLFARARAEGVVRDDLNATDVLTLIAALPESPHTPGDTWTHLGIVLRGIRA